MTPRRFLFWIHLTDGCVAGLVILVMSVTGILLAYLRQIITWSYRSFQAQPATGAQHLPLEDLLATMQEVPRTTTLEHYGTGGFRRSGVVRLWPGTYCLRRSLHRKNSGRRITRAAEIFLSRRGCASLAGGRRRGTIFGTRGNGSVQPHFPHPSDDRAFPVVAETMESRQPKKDHSVSGRSVGSRARLELAQRPGVLVRRTAIPDCDHGRDHVLCVGQQSALSHDWEYVAISEPTRSSESC